MMKNEAVIEFSEAGVVYRSGARVGPLSLEVSAGEFVALAGPNGSGKSTLLNLITRRVQPETGRVRTLPGRKIATLPQRHVFNDLAPVTVEDVVSFGCLPSGISREKARNQVDRALAETGTEALRNRLFRELSGGQKQLAQIARLIAQDASVWLLDEPLAGLDLKWRRIVVSRLDNLYAKRKPAIVYVTHQLDCFPASCSRALLLDGGRIHRDGLPREVLSPESLERLFGKGNDVGVC